MVPAMAQAVAGWKTLSAGALSLSAPPGTDLLPARRQLSWRLAGAGFELRVDLDGADGDDAEPALCYEREAIVIDGRSALLRVAKPAPRLDCPERYMSLYVPPAGAKKALYVSGLGDDDNALVVLRTVILSIRIAD
jgi:hypothetical protein